MSKIYAVLDNQIRKNSRVNLLYEQCEDTVAVDDSFKRFLEVAKRERWPIHGCIPWLVDRTTRCIYDINQFIVIGAGDKKALAAIYHNSWVTLDIFSVEETIRRHHKQLSWWLYNLYPESYRHELAASERIGALVNAEYSAEFQVHVMGIPVGTLKEPVIDVGCGSQGNLVRYLRCRGYDVIGIDRILDDRYEIFIETDWFDYDFYGRRWGTIIANMSFTNHMIHAALYDRSRLETYCLKYAEMLGSLKQGGKLFYAPSVPGVERGLNPKYYMVERRESERGPGVTVITRTGE